ncbi:WSCD family member AGAP003962-like [Haliotis rufescens]|uniref:WSCD family member AGAP003962-like n=1 Tax=Haliotis rufescens TaxID=6454 RepID=UPI001EB09E88|nr:WSCD family member AGAP003962-like [Haliotis rufescens]XP_046326382.1 WSCD family member AGAP003962-like [Haliotis rufescens]XP_048250701.1 WSCD family member AGAP003962-like [Haliotis rufescens]
MHLWYAYMTPRTIVPVIFGLLLTVVAVEHIFTMTILHGKSTPFSRMLLSTSGNGSDLHCPSVRLSAQVLPQIALASYPGSGNTWVRHLLQQMTGIATGSVYTDEDLRLHGFPGESLSNGSVVAVKTHQLFDETFYDRTILIIRNPYETFLSLFKYIKANHTGAPIIDKYFTEWGSFTANEIGHYSQFYTSWMKHLDVLPIFYDALKQNLTQELHRIKVFLGQSGIKGDIRCALANADGNHLRKHSAIPLDFFYSKEKRLGINLLINQTRKMFKDRFRNVSESMETWML